MRKPILVIMTAMVCVLALATVAMAADPIIGSWKLNLAQSKLTPDPLGLAAPKEWTEVVRELGDQYEGTGTGIRTDGSPISYKWTSPKQGGAVKVQMSGLPEGIYFVRTAIEPGDEYWTLLVNDKQVRVSHFMFKDGKTMRETIKGNDAKGKPIEGLEVWEKQ
jgi:hypothetical protein